MAGGVDGKTDDQHSDKGQGHPAEGVPVEGAEQPRKGPANHHPELTTAISTITITLGYANAIAHRHTAMRMEKKLALGEDMIVTFLSWAASRPGR